MMITMITSVRTIIMMMMMMISAFIIALFIISVRLMRLSVSLQRIKAGVAPDVDFHTATAQVQHAVVWSKSLTVARETVRFNISLKLRDQLVTLWPRVNLPMLNRPSCFIPQGSKAGQPLKPPCRPGFSQNFYTVIVSRDVLHGQSILKGKSAAAGSHLLTDGIFSSLPRCVPNLIVWSVIERVSVCLRTYTTACAIARGSPSQGQDTLGLGLCNISSSSWAHTCTYPRREIQLCCSLGWKKIFRYY